MIYSIDLDNHTATAINGVCFKLTETEPGIFKGVCMNPEVIPPDDLDEVILARMIIETLASHAGGSNPSHCVYSSRPSNIMGYGICHDPFFFG